MLGQQPVPRKQTSRVRTERSIEIENLLGRARSLPPEFAIDIFFRVQKSNRVDKQWRKEILEEAFTLTTSVQNELLEKSTPFPGGPADTRAGYRSLAFALNLDSLSLRSNIIEEMLSIDKTAALRMLNEIPPKLPFKTRSCSAQTVYDVSKFYRVLEKIAWAVYDEKRIQQGERVQFILRYVESMSSPAQITPVLDLLISLKLRQNETFILSRAFAAALKNIATDDRSFSAALISDRTISKIFRLGDSYGRMSVAFDEIRTAYRSYVSRHLNAARCEDSLRLLEEQLKELNYFYPDNVFSIDETKPRSVEKTPARKPYFETSQAKTLLSELKELRGYDDDDPASREPYTSASWQEKMLDYLRRLEAWDGSSEADGQDYFHQACLVYQTLFQIAPAGTPSDHVLISYSKLLGQQTAISESRVEWLWHVTMLIRRINEKPSDERMRLLNILSNSKNPILQIYGDLAKTNLYGVK